MEKLGVSRPTFYRWYDRYLQRGEAALEDRKPHPGRVWNRIPDDVRQAMLQMALARPELSPRELAVTFTDERSYFVSESSVYRLLRSHDLITSPNFIVMKAADEFRDKTTAPNQLSLSSPQAATAGQRANRLHLSQGYWLGLVLLVDRLG